jgi:hypothetical protein
MHVIAYTYEADDHCIACTVRRSDAGEFKPDSYWLEQQGSGTDEHGIAYAATDAEGNNVHPLFSTDEWQEENQTQHLACADCNLVIEEFTHE